MEIITPIGFEEAIAKARENLKKLYPKCSKIQLEQAVLSRDGENYEITLSFSLHRQKELSLEEKMQTTSAFQLMQMMASEQMIKKNFLIDSKTGNFNGLKEIRD